MDISDHIEDMAKEFAGNHNKFKSFAWHDEPEDSKNWCIIYTSNRDSGLLTKSNEKVINEELSKFDESQARKEHHGHWACGYVDGWAIRVFDKDGKITDAFKKYCELKMRMEEYPILDENDYSISQYEQTLQNIESIGSRFVKNGVDDSWPCRVWQWLSENEPNALDDNDDQGGYPTDENVKDALAALQYLDEEEEEE